MARRWTIATLRHALLVALKRPDVHLHIRRLESCQAHLHYVPNGPASMTVDPLQVSLINAAVHELLHYLLDANLDPFLGLRLKEIALEAWEARIAQSICSSPTEYNLWSAAIRRKLGEG